MKNINDDNRTTICIIPIGKVSVTWETHIILRKKMKGRQRQQNRRTY